MRRARSAVLTVLVAVGLSVAVGPQAAFAAAPSISNISPASGPVGTPVTISGTGFTGATSVAFAATEATFTVDTDQQISTSVPTGASSGVITVTTPDGSGASPSSFTVIVAPAVTGFSPDGGIPGSSVAIAGSGFTGSTAVTFNGTAGAFNVDSDVQITATVPAAATSGPIEVTNAAGSADSPTAFTVLPDPALVGSWSEPQDLGIIPIHMALLHTGQVMLYERPQGTLGSAARLYDPSTGLVTDADLPFDRQIFCSGLSELSNGQLFVTGGQATGQPLGDGIKGGTVFDPATSTWSATADMKVSRWYPTNVALPSGKVLVMSGQQVHGKYNKLQELYDPAAGTFSTLPHSAQRKFVALYPRSFVMPDGRVFVAGGDPKTAALDLTTNTWTEMGNLLFGTRSGGSAVLLPGLHQILTAGGGNSVGTNTAEVFDYDNPSAGWAWTGSMNYARRSLNLVLLPTGHVLAVGGNRKGPRLDPVYAAEDYDPATGSWSVLASMSLQRSYHSTALLLPDGRVLSAGADTGLPDEHLMQIYSPPYLFNGPRPVITSAPDSLTYGQHFAIGTDDPAGVSRVELIRPGAVTHSNNMDQRLVDLTFGVNPDTGQLEADAPANANLAPPGYYMLFILSAAGTPSVSTWVHVS